MTVNQGMIVNAITLLILCMFAFVPLLLGELARNKSVPTIEDFALQRRQMNILPMYATVFGTWMSVFAFMGGVSSFYERGPIYMTTIGWDALFAVMFYFIGRRIWFYGRKHKYITPVDFFSDIYDSRLLNIIVTIIEVVCTMVYLQAQIIGALLVMKISTDGMITWYIGGIIFFGILIVYLWAGGLRAVAFTDMFYSVLIIVAILCAGFYLMNVAGGTDKVFDDILSNNQGSIFAVNDDNLHVAVWVALFFVIPIGAFMGPQIWIRNYASGSKDNFYILPFLLCLSSIICVGTLFSGSAGAVLGNPSDNPDSLFLELIEEYANDFFYIFIIVGIYASIFSTANSQVHALSTVITLDIYKKYINKNAPDMRLVKLAKWMVVIVSLISYLLIIIFPQSIFDMVVIALGGMMQLIVPVMGAFFWKRSTADAAISGILFGETIFIFLMVMEMTDTSICAVIGTAINIFIFIIVSLAGAPRITVYRKIEEYRKEYNKL